MARSVSRLSYYSGWDAARLVDIVAAAVTCRLEPIENPFGPKLLPMSPD
jgi:hypothetical protein